MEKYWLRHEGSDSLVVFALGWASDHRVAEHIVPVGCDVLCLYDYRAIESICDCEFSHYTHRYLFAWSFGVWVAEQVLKDVHFDRAVALNGTPFPVDNQYGIELKRMMITMRGLQRNGIDEFNRRTYGSSYDRLKDCLSPRSVEENVEELATLVSDSSQIYTPCIEWDMAIVGSDDVIFSPQNMVAYWGIRAKVLPLPHYPLEDAELIYSEIENR